MFVTLKGPPWIVCLFTILSHFGQCCHHLPDSPSLFYQLMLAFFRPAFPLCQPMSAFAKPPPHICFLYSPCPIPDVLAPRIGMWSNPLTNGLIQHASKIHSNTLGRDATFPVDHKSPLCFNYIKKKIKPKKLESDFQLLTPPRHAH